MVKNLPANAARWKRHVFDPQVGKMPWRREVMATHSGILAWRIPWRGEAGGLRPTGSH